jgi:hypothetical protein
MRVSSSVPKVIQQLLTSSSSSSCHFYPQMEKLPHYHFSWIVSFKNTRIAYDKTAFSALKTDTAHSLVFTVNNEVWSYKLLHSPVTCRPLHYTQRLHLCCSWLRIPAWCPGISSHCVTSCVARPPLGASTRSAFWKGHHQALISFKVVQSHYFIGQIPHFTSCQLAYHINVAQWDEAHKFDGIPERR